MKSFEWSSPARLEEVVEQLAQTPNAVVKAGGVDLVDLMKEGLVQPSRVINLSGIAELRGVRRGKNKSIRIGALTTLAEIAEHEELGRGWRALALAAQHAATPQLRNMATLGGNLVQRPRCWYFRSADFVCRKNGGQRCQAQDGENQYHAIFGNQVCAIVHPSTPATALTALGATVHLAGPQGRRSVKIEDFFVPPEEDVSRESVRREDEIIVEVELPAPSYGWRSAYHKQTHKLSFDWPIADVAVAAKMDGPVVADLRIALGAAAPVPMRAHEAEAVLRGQRNDEELRARAASKAMASATPLSKNAYKLRVFEAVIGRVLGEVLS
jgi:xanthine dehydrogenase YagS FAD-binding subunit